MGGQFETYGPFPIPYAIGDMDKKHFADWFAEMLEVNYPGLSNAVGIYIVCEKSTSSKLIPWYVGKTVRVGFLKRFRQHSEKKKAFGGLQNHWQSKQIVVFLLASLSGKRGGFRGPAKGTSRIVAVDAIEEMLISDCVKVNSKLLNKSYKTLYRDLSVPGYVGKKKSQSSASAKALAHIFTDAK